MELQYLKAIFKSGKSIIFIWGAIALGVKSPVHILEKKSPMNSNIYINQVLEELGLFFYKQYIGEKSLIIWMNDGVDYHMSKTNTEYCCCVGLIFIDLLA